MCCVIFVFFFFKQKTAYEMRISDWSSDVCSSDLLAAIEHLTQVGLHVEPRDHAVAHLVVENAVAVPALVLRPVERRIGVAQQGQRCRPGGGESDADRRGDHEAAIADGEGLLERLEDRKSTRLNSSH